MSTLRAGVRLVSILAVTSGVFATWWLGRLLTGSSSPRAHAWRRHAMRRWSRALVSILDVKIEIAGPIPPAPCVLVSNHCGYVDIPVLACCANTVFVSKTEVRSWPLIGGAAASIGTIFIDRKSRRTIPQVNAAIGAALDAGDRVLFFPEGTSTDGSAILPFKSSLLEPAAQSGYPVFCAAVRYSTSAGEPPASQSVCWWGDMEFTPHVKRLLRLSRIRAQVEFHPQPLQDADRKLLAERTEQLVGDMLRRLIDS